MVAVRTFDTDGEISINSVYNAVLYHHYCMMSPEQHHSYSLEHDCLELEAEAQSVIPQDEPYRIREQLARAQAAV